MNRRLFSDGQNATIRTQGKTILCAGDWTVHGLKGMDKTLRQIRLPEGQALFLDLTTVSHLDSAGAWLIVRLQEDIEKHGSTLKFSQLPSHFAEMIELVNQSGFTIDQLPRPPHINIISRIGQSTRQHLHHLGEFIGFIGQIGEMLTRQIFLPGRIRWYRIFNNLAEAGYKALGIVGLLAFLLGIVIAYQGGIQLRQYGASLFIADLVGLSMVRELAPLITAIIVAGRTGSAYTAQIGTMNVTEELDAWRSLGVNPIELLVLPKLLTLVIALPLLTVYADITGILGGMLMAYSQLDLSFPTYLDRVGDAITLKSYLIGLGKTPVFALIIGTIGCYQGFQTGRSAESVGHQTTKSVVQAIFAVIVADALFSVAFSYLGL